MLLIKRVMLSGQVFESTRRRGIFQIGQRGRQVYRLVGNTCITEGGLICLYWLTWKRSINIIISTWDSYRARVCTVTFRPSMLS